MRHRRQQLEPAAVRDAVVQEFLRNRANARLVREEAQGLTFARLAGIKATSSPVIVVFDDDNLPDPNYLTVVSRLIREYPFVGVWGPGNVDVELIDPVPASLQQRVKAHHGQKRSRSVQYGLVPSAWYHFYPIGMGQVIRRDVAESYQRAVESGQLSATDRSGGSLASAGDSQIVWQAINLGLAAGTHPGLDAPAPDPWQPIDDPVPAAVDVRLCDQPLPGPRAVVP